MVLSFFITSDRAGRGSAYAGNRVWPWAIAIPLFAILHMVACGSARATQTTFWRLRWARNPPPGVGLMPGLLGEDLRARRRRPSVSMLLDRGQAIVISMNGE